MSTKLQAAPDENDNVPDGWSDLSKEERAELHREADEAEAEYVRHECIPLDDGARLLAHELGAYIV